jgi:hypothetical protein
VDDTPDFHVISLRYKLRPSDYVSYVSPTPVEFETDEVRFRLADGKLTCDMKNHIASQDKARAVVEPVLRAWEADADLRWNRGELRFEFDTADIIDRSPCPPGVVRGHAHVLLGVATISAVGTVSVHVGRASYPAPPGAFRLNPDAESLLLRYQGYRDGREPLLSMAYFCLTVLEANAGGRLSAARKYRIDKALLDKLGELTSRRGDRAIARKATAGPAEPLTGPETAWLEAAIKALIWQLGDTRNRMALPSITLDDLSMLKAGA